MRLTLIRLHHLRFKYDNPVNVLTLLVQAPVFTIGLITRLPPTNFKWLITTTILNPKNDNTFVAVAKSQMHFFWSLFTSWGERLRSPELQGKIRGPIYFMWGTDHEDQVCFIAFSILFSLHLLLNVP